MTISTDSITKAWKILLGTTALWVAIMLYAYRAGPYYQAKTAILNNWPVFAILSLASLGYIVSILTRNGKRPLQFLFSADGRIGRDEFFPLFVAIMFLPSFGVVLTATLSFMIGNAALLFWFLIALTDMVLRILLFIRRFHDMNRSGWSCLLLLVPLWNLVELFMIFFRRGPEGPNRFGNPLVAPNRTMIQPRDRISAGQEAQQGPGGIFGTNRPMTRLPFAIIVFSILAIIGYGAPWFCFDVLRLGYQEVDPGKNLANANAFMGIMAIFSILQLALLALPVVRRLHDIGKPAGMFWLLLIPVFNIGFLIYLCFKRGAPQSAPQAIKTAQPSSSSSAIRSDLDSRIV